MDKSLSDVRGVLEKMSHEKPVQKFRFAQDSQKYTAEWSPAHGSEPTALHPGHAQLIRQLMEKENKKQILITHLMNSKRSSGYE